MMYGDWHGGYGWAMMFLNLVFWLAAVGAITWLFVSLLRRTGPQPAEPTSPGSQALTILEERLARGEIGEEEFRLRRDLIAG